MISVLSMVMGNAMLRPAAAADLVAGVNLLNAPYDLPVAEQESILKAIQAADVRVIRAAVPDNDKGLDFARRVYAHGMQIELLVGLRFAEGTPWPITPKGFPGLWLDRPLSKVDPERLRALFEAQLAKLEAEKIVFVAFELGNEINWAGFNADFPLPGQGRVLGYEDLAKDPEGQQVARGFLQYLKALAALKDIRDHSKLNQHTPIVSAGLADLAGTSWPHTAKADAVGIDAALDFMRANGLDKLVDGYGIHSYPPAIGPGTREGAAKRNDHFEQNGLAECRPPGNANGKPCWITEWGFNINGDTCPVDDGDRRTLIRETRGYLHPLVQQGRLRGLLFFTWQGNIHAAREDHASAFRCGALTESGRLAISPM